MFYAIGRQSYEILLHMANWSIMEYEEGTLLWCPCVQSNMADENFFQVHDPWFNFGFWHMTHNINKQHIIKLKMNIYQVIPRKSYETIIQE